MTTKQDKLTALTYEQKLMALALKYYSNIVWIPKEGDYYTTSRNDLELYQIVEANTDCIVTKYCDPARGLETTSWAMEKFLEGFGVYRVHVPEFVFESCKKKQEQSQSDKPERDSLKSFIKERFNSLSYVKNYNIPCDFPQESFDRMIDKIMDEWYQSHTDKPERGEEEKTDMTLEKRLREASWYDSKYGDNISFNKAYKAAIDYTNQQSSLKDARIRELEAENKALKAQLMSNSTVTNK